MWSPDPSPHAPRRRSLLSLVAAIAAFLTALPARALDEVLIEIPLVEARFRVTLRELESAEALRRGSSDLAELDRASGGIAGRQLLELLRHPVPIGRAPLAAGSGGLPLLEQALLLIAAVGSVEGAPPATDGAALNGALERLTAKGDPTLLSLLQAIPGRRLTFHLGRARQVVNLMHQQRQRAQALLDAARPVAAAAPAPAAAALPVRRRLLSLRVPHRPQALEVMLLEPAARPSGRLVLISHGFWDTPTNFLGWAQLLASHGYSVAVPRHPGSDKSQQEAVLAGQEAPPGPEELALRPRDLSAVIDAAAAGLLDPGRVLDSRRVVVLGHSWGATTALQTVGVQPAVPGVAQRCLDVGDPERNLSWALQCSWLRGVRNPSVQDHRVIAVAAVSPPLSLLSAGEAAAGLAGRVLLVSGSRDWVVPPDPEAVEPMRWGRKQGHQLVLVRGGDHFNLRPQAAADGGVLGSLLLAWTDAAFAAGPAVRPATGAAPLLPPAPWGSGVLPMADVTGLLPNP